MLQATCVVAHTSTRTPEDGQGTTVVQLRVVGDGVFVHGSIDLMVPSDDAARLFPLDQEVRLLLAGSDEADRLAGSGHGAG